MPVYFSSAYAGNGVDETSLPEPKPTLPPGTIGYLRNRNARVDITSAANGDIIRLCSVKSSERLINLWGSWAALAGTPIMNIGLYQTGVRNSGAVISLGCIVNAWGTATTARNFYALAGAGTSDDLEYAHLGKQFWEIANIPTAIYTIDPAEEWDIGILWTTAPTSGFAAAFNIQTVD